MERPEQRTLTRRKLIALCAGGSLSGSAWAVAFREAGGSDETPEVTVARDLSSIAALIEHRGRRFLALDSTDPLRSQALTEQAAGMTRQRIDILLATSATSDVLHPDFMDRWRVASVIAIPDQRAMVTSLAPDRRLSIAGLSISGDVVPHRWWDRTSKVEMAPWYLTVSYGRARFTIASNGAALAALPLDPACVNVVICGDRDVPVPAGPPGIDALALPVESGHFAGRPSSDRPRLVPLHRNLPVTFWLGRDKVGLPNEV